LGFKGGTIKCIFECDFDACELFDL
jgi:hypothetical protein